MADLGTIDIVAPSPEVASTRLAAAIAVKQQMVDGPFAELAAEVASDDPVLACGRKGNVLRQWRISTGCRASRC